MLRRTGFAIQSHLESFTFSATLGLGLLGLLIFALGLSGWLYLRFILALLGVALLSGIPSLLSFKFSLPKIRFSPFWTVLTLLAGVGLVVSFVVTFAPPISTDELGHHLALPKYYLREHRILYRPYHVFSLLPSLTEMLYILGLALHGPALAKQIHWLLGFLGALSLASFAGRWMRPSWRWLAAALFLLTPGINNQLALAHNDVAAAVFSGMGFWALFRALEPLQNRWFVLAGVYFGFALGVKQTALSAFLAAFTVPLAISLQGWKRYPAALCSAFALAVGALLVGGVWYLRAYWLTGNPFYPYFHRLFGQEDPLLVFLQPERHGLGKSWFQFFLFPWNLTFRQEFFGGWGNQLGPAFLALLPGLFLVSKKPKEIRLVLFMVLEMAVLWFFVKQNVRFLFPAVPLLCLLVAFTVGRLLSEAKGAARSALQFLCILTLVLQTSSLVFNKRDFFRVSTGREATDEFLIRHVEGYPMAQYINRSLPRDARILGNELREYYFDRMLERHGGYFTRYASRCRNEGDFYRLLKQDGFTHLLWKEIEGDEDREALPGKLIESGRLNKLFETEGFVPSTGRKVRHRLYRL